MGEANQSGDQQAFILKILWFAILNTVAVFFFLSWKASQGEPPADPLPDTQIFAIMAGVVGAMSFVIPMILTPKQDRAVMGQKEKLTVAKIYVPSVLRLALSESVAVLGYLTTNTTKNFNDFLPFGIAAVLIILIHGMMVLNQIKGIKRQKEF